MRFSTLYIPDFPAWMAQGSQPDRESAVHLGGRVVALSEGLRALGIAPGWATDRVLAVAPDTHLQPMRATEVRMAREALLDDLNHLTPWLELLPSPTDREPLLDLRVAIALPREEDIHPLARRLRARLGMADDRATSLLASLATEPGTSRIVPPSEGAAFRARLPIGILRGAGISEATVERLHWLGFSTVGSVTRLTRRQAAAQFPDGEVLHDLVHGQGTQPVALFHPPPAVGARHDAPDPLHEPCEYEPVLSHLLWRALSQLAGRHAQVVTVSLSFGRRFPDAHARRYAHLPTGDFREWWNLARLALREAGGDRLAEGTRGPGIESLAVSLGGLVHPGAEQPTLWAERARQLQGALERLERQMPGSVLRFVPHEAASYLPEEAYQLVSALQGKRRSAGEAARRRSASPAEGGAGLEGQPAPKKRQASRRGKSVSVRHDGSPSAGSFPWGGPS